MKNNTKNNRRRFARIDGDRLLLTVAKKVLLVVDRLVNPSEIRITCVINIDNRQSIVS